MMRLQFDWPPKQLNPNAREYWARKAEFVQMGRDFGAMAVRKWFEDHEGPPEVLTGPLEVQYWFYPPDRRRRDLDNCHGMMKSYQDGVFQALGLDDSQIEIVEIRRREVWTNGRVVMYIQQADSLRY